MLTLHFGQCGNQLGQALYSKLAQDISELSKSYDASLTDELSSYEYVECSSAKWFEKSMNSNSENYARAILIDTERKVIDQIVRQNNNKWCFRPDNIITPGSFAGCANNWSLGYLKKGQDFEDNILEVVRRELERIDKLDGFLCLLGCAGGTGSGIGSYIIQSLRQEFLTKNIIGGLVFPFSSGEIAIQNYNIILSLSQIVDETDMIIILENERLDKELFSQMPSGITASSLYIDFPTNINEIASQKIVSILQPAKNIINDNLNGINNIIMKLIPHPAYKLATIETIPCLNIENTSDSLSQLSFWNYSTWQSHFNYLIKKILANDCNNCYSKNFNTRSLSNILITRGSNEFTSEKNYHKESNAPHVYNKLNHDKIYVETGWFRSSERFEHFHQNRRMFNREKYASIISNNSRIYKPLTNITSKAWNSYTHSAFLYQYKKYGLTDDDFLRAFAKIENIIDSYKDL